MKAITLYQPWASLLIQGHKKFETRSWKHSYTGQLAIHAATKKPHDTMRDLNHNIVKAIGEKFGIAEAPAVTVIALLNSLLPTGAILGTTYHVGCRPIDAIQEMRDAPFETGCWDGLNWIDPPEEEILFGDWTPGRFAWEQADPKPFSKPIPAKGKQGLWEWVRYHE